MPMPGPGVAIYCSGLLTFPDVPVCMFTFHGYHTWKPDHPRGYVRRDDGVLPPDPRMANHYDSHARFDEFRFDPRAQQIVVDAICEVATTIGVQLHYAVCVSTHAHPLVSWCGGYTWEQVHDRMKRVCALKLARAYGTRGRPYFSEGRDSNRVANRGHFEHLMARYLPDHHGVTWTEDRNPRSGH